MRGCAELLSFTPALFRMIKPFSVNLNAHNRKLSVLHSGTRCCETLSKELDEDGEGLVPTGQARPFLRCILLSGSFVPKPQIQEFS